MLILRVTDTQFQANFALLLKKMIDPWILLQVEPRGFVISAPILTDFFPAHWTAGSGRGLICPVGLKPDGIVVPAPVHRKNLAGVFDRAR